jgi:serine/threonine protein kinase
MPVKFLGKGSFGEIAEAVRIKDGKSVAIKMIKVKDTHRDYHLALREIQKLRQLTQLEGNNFTVKLMDVIATDPTHYDRNSLFLVMDLMPEDLRSLLDNESIKFKEH